ncbi:hypothetical protein LXL04_004258 [Taraxacum kok-saghyz]
MDIETLWPGRGSIHEFISIFKNIKGGLFRQLFLRSITTSTPLSPANFGVASIVRDNINSGITRRYTRSVSLQERINTLYLFEKRRVFSGSPESTLNWTLSRPTKDYSSPTMPLVQAEEHLWDLIYAAASQVVRMRMNNVGDNIFANRGLPGAAHSLRPPPSQHHHHHHHHHPDCAIQRSENEEYFRHQQFRQRVAHHGGRGLNS